MTFISNINTPATDNIKFNNDSSNTGDLIISGNCEITGTLSISGVTTFGNSSADIVNIDAGTVTSFNSSSPLTFTNNGLTSININNNTFVVQGTTRAIGIATNAPTELFHVGPSTISTFKGNTNFGNGALYVDQTNKRIGINKTNPAQTLDIAGSVLFSALTVDATNNRVGIGTTVPESKLYVLGSNVANAITDTDSVVTLEKSGRNVIQLITGPGAGNYNGVMFSGGPLAQTNPVNRHWSIFGNWGGAGAGTSNDLCFGFVNSSSLIPFSETISNTVGYLQFDVVVDYIDFTGQHLCLQSENELEFYQDKIGLIVVSDGTYCDTLDPNDYETTISINEALPKVKLSNKRNDKTVFGVISNLEDNGNFRYYSAGRFKSAYAKKPSDHRLIINAVGEGAIWICNINGDLENGDYITSCEIPGYGMKQVSDDLANYTVAKITCDCDFDLNSTIYRCEEFQFSGSTYRRALVGCVYHCG